MKKLLYVFVSLTALVVSGCNNAINTEEVGEPKITTENNNGATLQQKESKENINETKEEKEYLQSALIHTQMNLDQKLRAYHNKIASLKSDIIAVSMVKKENEVLKQNIQEKSLKAQQVADEAVEDIEAYYEKTKLALDDSLNVDFSKANEQFSDLQERIQSMFRDIELRSPNLEDKKQ